MSARVYLFADFGKGPRVVKFWEAGESGPGHFRFLSAPRDLVEADFRCLPGSKGSGVTASGIPVWLVECESAEAGRACITCWTSPRYSGLADRRGPHIYRDRESGTESAYVFGSHQDAYRAGYELVGTILASGGAA